MQQQTVFASVCTLRAICEFYYNTTMISSVCTVPSLSIELSLSTVHSVSTDQSVYLELIDAMSHISLYFMSIVTR